MAELPSNPNSTPDDTSRGSTPNPPGWVKVFGVIFIGLGVYSGILEFSFRAPCEIGRCSLFRII